MANPTEVMKGDGVNGNEMAKGECLGGDWIYYNKTISWLEMDGIRMA